MPSLRIVSPRPRRAVVEEARGSSPIINYWLAPSYSFNYMPPSHWALFSLAPALSAPPISQIFLVSGSNGIFKFWNYENLPLQLCLCTLISQWVFQRLEHPPPPPQFCQCFRSASHPTNHPIFSKLCLNSKSHSAA